MKIVICGLVCDDNLGEHFIAKSLEWLIQDELKVQNHEIMFCEADLFARRSARKKWENLEEYRERNYKYYDSRFKLIERLYDGIGRRKSKFGNHKNIVYIIRHYLWQIGHNYKNRYKRYFLEKFTDADLIVVDGAGLLEYSFNEYQEMLSLICRLAEKNNIPVIFNAIGSAGEFDKNDYRCKILMKAFNRKTVRYVSARDSKENVQECVGNKFNVKLLADAAVWANRAFGVEKNCEKGHVGIGLIRSDAMKSYGNGLSNKDLIEIIASIALELENRGYRYKFFTNGLPQDYETGLLLLERLNLDGSYLIERPTEGQELIKTISKFEGIITFRMHSAIAAFSMGIPSVILSWNNKVNKFMEICGYSDRAINQSNFDPKYIVDTYEKSVLEGISEENLIRMKDLARESVADYIHEI